MNQIVPEFASHNYSHLPTISALKTDESTYIAFSKAHQDLDRANVNGTEYYFTKAVFINLPDWEEGSFYTNPTITNEQITNANGNPNFVIPKYIQYYLENIIRQKGYSEVPRITEYAFWKMLKVLGVQYMNEIIVGQTQLVVSDYHTVDNANGYAKIICSISPLKGKTNYIPIPQIEHKDIPTGRLQTNDLNRGIYDNGNNEFTPETYELTGHVNEQPINDIKFNCVLLFYRDSDGVDKLHGINFITPFKNKASQWVQERLSLTTNFGYQFIFNMKTCYNDATLTKVHEINESMFWYSGFEQLFGKLNTLLDLKLKENAIARTFS